MKPLQKSLSCSPQLLVVDKHGVQWRLHSGHRSLTSLGVEVQCQALVPRIAFPTIEGQYVAQGPDFEVLPLNFSTPSDNPDMLNLAQEKWFVRENPFRADLGLYTAEEVEASQSSFLREWSLLSGTPPASILESRDVQAPASAAAAAHRQVMDRGGKLAASGLHHMGAWAVGRMLSMLEFAVIDILLLRLTTTIIHLGGCFWKGGVCKILSFAICPTWAMAIRARRGHRHPARPVEEDEGEPGPGGEGGRGSWGAGESDREDLPFQATSEEALCPFSTSFACIPG